MMSRPPFRRMTMPSSGFSCTLATWARKSLGLAASASSAAWIGALWSVPPGTGRSEGQMRGSAGRASCGSKTRRTRPLEATRLRYCPLAMASATARSGTMWTRSVCGKSRSTLAIRIVGTDSIADATSDAEICSSERPAAARATASRTATRSLWVPPRTATLCRAKRLELLTQRYPSPTMPAARTQATAATTTAAARRRTSTAAVSCTRPVSPRLVRLLPPEWVGSDQADGPEQLHFVLQIDPEALAHTAPGERDQSRDIRRTRVPRVLDEVRVHRRDARAADDAALQLAALDQGPGAGALVWILEHRPERARLAWLALAPPALHLPDPFADLVAHAALELQHDLGDDFGAAHVRVPVAQIELRRPARAHPRRGDDLGRGQHVADLAAIGAGVHAHGTAHRARDGASELDPGERGLGRAADDRGQRRAAAAAYGRAVDLDGGQRALEMQREAVVARVGDEQVRAEPDHGDVELLGIRPGQHLRELLRRRRTSQEARRPAGADRGQARERRAGLDSRRRGAHPSCSRTSPSTESTGPAPSVSTRSPGRAVRTIQSAASPYPGVHATGNAGSCRRALSTTSSPVTEGSAAPRAT